MVKLIALILVGALSGAGAMHWIVAYGRTSAHSMNDFSQQSELVAPVPTSARTSFIIEGNAHPATDLEESLQLSDARLQRQQIRRVAVAWAARDPLEALAAAEQLPGRLRMVFRATVDTEWAHTDPAGYLQFVEANPGYLAALNGPVNTSAINSEYSGGIRELIASDPLSVVRLADRLPSKLGSEISVLALSAYAESDPLAAIALAGQMPRGPKRDNLMASVAAGYARADPEGALAWVRSLSPRPPNALGNALQSIAVNDIGRAMELALQPPASADDLSAMGTVFTKALEDAGQARIAADTLQAIDISGRDTLLSRFLTLWTERDPESSLAWVRANDALLSPSILSDSAVSLASRDPTEAARYLDMVPISMRDTWITRTAQGYANANISDALAWISRYEGQPGYEAGMGQILGKYAMNDPVAAARVIEFSSASVQLASAGNAADLWARQDPIEATEWSRRLSDPGARATAVAEAVGQWSTQDAQAAEDWTLSLPPGADRDQAIVSLLRGRALTELPREAYSTNTTAALIGHLTDADLRSEAETWFDD